MSSFNLLRREIREYIYDQGWPSLSKIQEASIKYVSETNCNLILSAPTSSGKTEAAFLPAINSIDNWNSGLKIIYVSPLIALINDQFKRIVELCKYLNINVTSWHGEASKTKKKNLLNNPNGILLITPESIEAMLSLRPGEAVNLLSGVEWILIDEIHGFLDNNRGIHLGSLLERMHHYIIKKPRYISMSATLHNDDSQIVKNFFKNKRETIILLDRTRNKLTITKDFFPDNIKKQSYDAINLIYEFSQRESMLVFPNSRSDVEYLSVNLSKLGNINNSYTQYFAHHSSVSKDLRISAENFAKSSSYELFTICCTSTLEMGIDIGSVDSIVQYNAPHSVSSLAQRLGRSGRKTKESILHFVSTNPWDLLQGLAAISLYEDEKLDRIDFIRKPYDVLAHQVISILLERSGLKMNDFNKIHKDFSSWNSITDHEFEILIQHLIKENYIELLENEAIAGQATEKLLKGAEFFAHFISEVNYSVFNDVKKIGDLPLTPSISLGVNIFLAAQIWKIIDINFQSKKIFVTKAIDGNPPIFLSGRTNVSHTIRERMKEILLFHNENYNFPKNIKTELDIIASDVIVAANPYWVVSSSKYGFRTFAGSKINNTILLLFNIAIPNITFALDDKKTLITYNDSSISLKNIIKKTIEINWSFEIVYEYFEEHMEIVDRYMDLVKYNMLLPLELKIRYIIENFLDIDDACTYLRLLYTSFN